MDAAFNLLDPAAPLEGPLPFAPPFTLVLPTEAGVSFCFFSTGGLSFSFLELMGTEAVGTEAVDSSGKLSALRFLCV